MTPTRLWSWGRFPDVPQTPTVCHWRGDLEEKLAIARGEDGTTLPFGAGRSYGDSCLAASGNVLHVRALDRFVSADWSIGVVTAEAGVTLDEILAVAIPRGWFLAVTPGTKYVTLGGAIANDVHGKNHHKRGTFGRHVRRFGLMRSDAGHITCDPSTHAELFAATIGGLGLTGVIEWAEIQLVAIRSSRVDQVTQRFGNLDEFFTLSNELDAQHEFGMSWVDCAASGQAVGRGIYAAGDFAETGGLTVEAEGKLSVPFTPPTSLVNGWSLRAFNEVVWRRGPVARKTFTTGYNPYFYPLDAIHNWNRMYGPKGFQQYQALIPEREARPGIEAMLTAIAQSGTGSVLAVLKRCGDLPSPGLMSFPKAGTTLALDFPQSDDLVSTLFPRLDAIVREAGGRIYPAKDAHVGGDDFRHSYPAWQQLEAHRDPALMSRFWKRVTQ